MIPRATDHFYTQRGMCVETLIRDPNRSACREALTVI